MALKDILTIAVAIVAVIVSVIAFVVSARKTDEGYRRKNIEDERTLRLSLNEVIGKIISSRVDHANIWMTTRPRRRALLQAGL
jgi:uncharacterized membrane protein